MVCDLTNLVLQAVGGAISSTAVEQGKVQLGINVIIAGLVTQVVSLVMFTCFGIEFAARVYRRRGEMEERYEELRRTKLWKMFLAGEATEKLTLQKLIEILGLSLATLGIFVRSTFRISELSQGFSGPLANNEVTFMVCRSTVVYFGHHNH